MADAVRSSGSLIGAVLESVGYHYQALVLDQLTDPMTNEVGGLIYLVGIVVAVTLCATQGSFRLTPWLLIGPPLFFSMILPREPIENARWEFNFQGRDQAKVNSEVRRITSASGSGGGQANVSTFFARYVELVSTVVREMVHVISSERRDEDLWFILRAELFSLMHTIQIDNPHFERLFQLALLNECGEVLEAARAANDPLFRRANNPDKEENDLVDDAQVSAAYFRGNQQQALNEYNTMKKVKHHNLDADAARAIAAEIASGGNQYRDVANEISQGQYSCEELWRIAVVLIERLAARELEQILLRGEAHGIERDALLNIMEQAHGIQRADPVTYSRGEVTSVGAENVKRIIAKFILRNEHRSRSKSAFVARFISRLDTRDFSGRFQGTASYTEFARLGNSEWSEKERLMHAAGNLPYYQGLALYFLGMTFPFFALLLLVPGKQGGFILWFTLWLWVKSWDVALAVVMLLDDTLFAMLSIQKQTIGQKDGTLADQDMAIAFASLGEMDPTFQLTTYYTIIATCVLAIPPTMAQLILGSLRSGATLIASGMEKSSTYFSKNVQKGVEQMVLSDLKQEALDLKAAQLKRVRDNVESGAGPFALGSMDEKGRPNNPGARNPVMEYHRFAGGSAAGPQGKPGTPITPEAAHQRQLGLAGAVGRAQGLHSPDRHFSGKEGPSPIAGAAIRAQTAHMRTVGDEYLKNYQSLRSADQKALAAAARYGTDMDDRNVQLHRAMAINGGIPIPFTGFRSHDSAELFDLAIQRQLFDINMTRANWAASRETIHAFRVVATEVAKGSTKLGPMDPGSLLTLDQINKLDETTRYAIRTRYAAVLQSTRGVTNFAATSPMVAAAAGGIPEGTAPPDTHRAFWDNINETIWGKKEGDGDEDVLMPFNGMSPREYARLQLKGPK